MPHSLFYVLVADTCTQNLIAAVNFQMRYVPHIIALRDMINKGLLGEVYDMEVRMQINTPWHLWSWLEDKPRFATALLSVYLSLLSLQRPRCL